MSLRADFPTATDALDTGRIVRALLESAFPSDRAPVTPLVIGIHGRWGSGKSSVLLQLKAVLDQRPVVNDVTVGKIARHYKVFDFQPWAYQHEEHLLVPLLLTLIEGSPKSAELKKDALKLGKVALRFLINRIPIVEEIKKAGAEEETEAAGKNPPPDLSDLVKFKEEVKRVVGEIRGAEKHILVVLVDDLDRCHPPQRVVDLLEQIKVFLDLEGCVFVLACDRHVVSAAIETRFPGEGAAYLEKFIQLPLQLPAPQPHHLAALVKLNSPPGRVGEWEAYWGRIAEVLGGNPRRLVRLHNQYLTNVAIIRASGSTGKLDDFLLVKWLLLTELVPGVADDPALVLRIEAALPEYKPGDRWWGRDLGLAPTLAAFLQMDQVRQFKDFSGLSVYSRLSTRENEMTRARAERMVRQQEPFPASVGPADLSWAFLPGANFSKCTLSQVNFSDANLAAADFSGATLEQCDFCRAETKGINLTDVKGLETSIEFESDLELLKVFEEQNLKPKHR